MKLGDLIFRINNCISEIIIYDKKYKSLERKYPIKILNFDYDVYNDIDVIDFTIVTNNKNNDVIVKIFTSNEV